MMKNPLMLMSAMMKNASERKRASKYDRASSNE